MKKLLLASLALAAFAARADVTVEHFTGSTTMEGLIKDVIQGEGFADNGTNDHDVLVYEPTGSGDGESALVKGKQSLSPMSRPFNPDLKAKVEANQKNLKIEEHAVALDGIAVLVRADSPVKSFDAKTLKDIYTCVITDWSKIPGSGKSGPIVVWQAELNSGTSDAFGSFIGLKIPTDKKVSDCVTVAANADEIGKAVQTDGNAIGYAGINQLVAGKNRSVEIATTAGQNGVVATEDTIRDGSYPFTRYLFVYAVGRYDVKQPIGAPADATISNAHLSIPVEAAFLKVVTHRGTMDEYVSARHFVTLPKKN